MKIDSKNLAALAKTARYLSLLISTKAGSGHPTSSLSAADLMVTLLFGGFFKADLEDKDHTNNDRLVFSKGHASPLYYALYFLAGKITPEQLETYRKLGSVLEGHPRPNFPYTEAATGSLGQGLSIGAGMAINAKYLDKLPYKTFVLLGDSECAEGSVWEAAQIASHYKLDNLVAILDVNRLGQRGQTLHGHDLKAYVNKFKAFGWDTIAIDGHSTSQICKAYKKALSAKGKPFVIIAKTIKGKGVTFLENQEGWHGKALKPDEFEKAAKELGNLDLSIRGQVAKPKNLKVKINKNPTCSFTPTSEVGVGLVSTRKAYGNALVRIYPKFPNMVVLDAEVGNSTFSETFQKAYPERFFEMYIAEQNMVGVAQGLSSRGKIPFVSTFAAFLTRAHDQVRMSQYSNTNIKFVGSHAGVSIGEDGPSQMGLEDIAMFRSMFDTVVLYPSDALSAEKLVEAAAKHQGNVYIRTTRKDTPILYKPGEQFPIGGCKVLVQSPKDQATIIAAGISVHEALLSYELLKKQGIPVAVIDLYSIKPLDTKTLTKAYKDTNMLLVVEDHLGEGGIGEAVRSAVGGGNIFSLSVSKIPGSAKPDEQLEFEGLDANSIAQKIIGLLKSPAR